MEPPGSCIQAMAFSILCRLAARSFSCLAASLHWRLRSARVRFKFSISWWSNASKEHRSRQEDTKAKQAKRNAVSQIHPLLPRLRTQESSTDTLPLLNLRICLVSDSHSGGLPSCIVQLSVSQASTGGPLSQQSLKVKVFSVSVQWQRQRSCQWCHRQCTIQHWFSNFLEKLILQLGLMASLQTTWGHYSSPRRHTISGPGAIALQVLPLLWKQAPNPWAWRLPKPAPQHEPIASQWWNLLRTQLSLDARPPWTLLWTAQTSGCHTAGARLSLKRGCSTDGFHNDVHVQGWLDGCGTEPHPKSKLQTGQSTHFQGMKPTKKYIFSSGRGNSTLTCISTHACSLAGPVDSSSKPPTVDAHSQSRPVEDGVALPHHA